MYVCHVAYITKQGNIMKLEKEVKIWETLDKLNNQDILISKMCKQITDLIDSLQTRIRQLEDKQ